MGQQRNLAFAIAATISMSAITGCSVGTDRVKSIPTHATASSPTIIQEEVSYLSGTRTRSYQARQRQPHQYKASPTPQKPAYTPARRVVPVDDSDLLYAANVLLSNSAVARPQARQTIPSSGVYVSPRGVRKTYKPAKQRSTQVYKVSQKPDSILDNPAYEQVLLELAGMAPRQQRAPAVIQKTVAQRKAPPRFVPAAAANRSNTATQLPNVPHEDMWNHIKAGYQMGQYTNRREVQRHIREYGSNPARLQRIANRATDYLHIVVNELKRRRMPTELALLPFVESAYVNTAHSHAGAAGMWQFIPSTGRLYGLKQNRGFDGRMDALESTRAALDYLQKLHREFKGDWFLALAAYNAGEGRVGRAIRYNRARGRKTDFWSLKLPRETREYVPRLLAYKQIIARPQVYGFHLPRTPNMPKLVEIHVNKPVNLRKAAAHAGLPADTLTSLNPNFLKGVTTPRVSKRILLPRHQAGRLAHVIHQLPAAKAVSIQAKTTRYKKRYKKSTKRKTKYRTHRVKRGETLYRIAMRHGLTVNKLKRLNRMRSNRIKTGTRLRLI